MMLRSFIRVMLGMGGMTVRGMRMMARLLVVAGFVMFGRFLMMSRGVLMMLGGLAMMFRALVLRHCFLLLESKLANG